MTNYRPLPPVDELRELFKIDDELGLVWKKKPHSKAHVEEGDVAGAVGTSGYRRVTIKGTRYYAHRIVWTLAFGSDPGALQIDHINRNPLDNTPANLRLANNHQNALNRNEPCSSSTGESCIYFTHRKASPYKAVAHGKHLGNFATMEEAKKARDAHRGLVRDRLLGASSPNGMML
jgi:hypothetical protein